MTKKQILIMLLAMVGSTTMVMADSVNGINMNFVPIGNAGNAADGSGYGAVGYNYRIGQTEVTISQFQAATGAGSGNEAYWSGVDASTAPASRISYVEAAQFCNFMTSGSISNGAYAISGGQVTGVTAHSGAAMDSLVSTYGQVYVMPTENEWYKAAYFKDGSYSLYANGTSTIPTQGVDANYGAVASAWAVGSGTTEQNGTEDMMGNVWEWSESAFDGTLDLPVAESILFRGGAYNNSGSFLASSSRASDSYSLEHQAVGMRVVAIPEPGTISFMSLSTVGLFFTRTIRRRKRLGQTLVPVRREHRCDTFGEAQDLHAVADEDTEDYLAVAFTAMKEGCLNMWTTVRHSCKEVDKSFWNRMVVAHERKMARRQAFRQSAKKKAIDRLDAFLALIMK